MRIGTAASICCAVMAWMALGSCACAEQNFPYKAYVTTDGVEARSGPGESYDPTERLAAGTEVEVHRSDPAGWYAIRPLPESFSWVSGEHLKPGRDGLAEVVADQAPARVGSQFSDAHDVSQVRLDRGEVVTILGSKQLEAGSGGTWYKIAPPAGEFRWLPAQYVDQNYRPQVNEAPSAPSRSRGPSHPAASGSRTRRHAASSTSARRSEGGTRGLDPAGARREPIAEPAPAASGVAPEPLSAVPTPLLAPEQLQAELESLDSQLSSLLAQDIATWNCDALASRAERLMAQSPSAVERGYVRTVSSRIEQAQALKRRYDAVNSAQPGAEQTSERMVQMDRTRPIQAGATDDRYDGVGRLARVHSSRVGAPRYALTDSTGKVRAYVNPAPGVNVRSYLGRQVGVTGTRSTLSDGRAEQLTAKQITPLDAQLR